MKLSEVRKTVSRIKASLFKNSNSFSIGMLKSHFKGSGLQFKEHQLYTFGDDIRFVDWKLLAKTNTPFMKTFEEERNVEITVVLDVSRTMLSGVDGVSKLQAGIEITCLLYLLASETNDYVHVLVMGDGIIDIPKSQGDKGIAYLISTLERNGLLDAEGRVEIERTFECKDVSESKKIQSILKHTGKNREVVILSDFKNFIGMDSLKRLVFRRNLHCFKMNSPLDYGNSKKVSIYTNNGPSRASYKRLLIKQSELYDDKMILNKIKNINIEDRYLESFIREMV